MAPPPRRVGGTVTLPVQVRMFPEEIAGSCTCTLRINTLDVHFVNPVPVYFSRAHM
jgi:hypothetical protein